MKRSNSRNPEKKQKREELILQCYQAYLEMVRKFFLRERKQHSAVESAINALDHHGLDRCPDHGIYGFERYVALGIVGRNLQRLGGIILEKEKKALKRREKLRLAA